MTATEINARFALVEIVRLSVVPVGVVHRRQRLAEWVGRRYSPDESGLARWIYTLAGRPEVGSLNAVAVTSAQCCL